MRLKKCGFITALIFLAGLAVFAQEMQAESDNQNDNQNEPVKEVSAFRAALNKMMVPVDYHWYIGVYGGYANNHLYTSTGYFTFVEYQNGHGWTIGLPVRYQFFSWLGVGVEPMFITKNYRRQRTEQYSAVYEELTNSFLDFPVYVNLSAGFDHLRVYTNLGVFMGVWLDSHVKGAGIEASFNTFDSNETQHYASYDKKREFDDRRDSLFDGGLFAGVGIQYALTPCTFFVEGRFYYSLSDLQKQYMKNMIPRMNDTWTVQAGVMFNAGIFNIFKKK
ncbi:hypothetical protein AGMMS50212_00670 [Spirochaetia bacterium]|nr:hypothetical protein AGMMS50212_00670 [Spirochaetia bacterium]